ncbi:diguanylate cyclase [Shewanella cyperi]|uniref:diguanylate cyclase n=1 Tax=Shewanella cyperi TaxID=2814292 RepID=A0A974XM11_9GAMM|nr:diguanylate cyclase [Shewanella cyperi]QSX29723.1 diguanylate cyclase [Shewanella cyperi]
MLRSVLWLVLLLSWQVHGQALQVNNAVTEMALTPFLQVYQAQKSQSWEQLPPQDSALWRPLERETLALGVHNLWLSFSLSSDQGVINRMLEMDNPLLDEVSLYHLVDGDLVRVMHMGDKLDFASRPMRSTSFLYPFELAPGEVHSFYLKIDSEGSGYLPVTLWAPERYNQVSESTTLFQGIQLGILLALGLFSLFIALASGSFSYSYYAGYVLSMTLLVATVQGLAFRFLWPNTPEVQQWIIPLLLPIVMAFALMFAEKMLQLKHNNIRMLRACRMGAAFSVLMALLSPLVSYGVAIFSEIIALLGISTMLLLFALIQAFKGQKLARLYSLGWIVLLSSAIASSLIYLGMVDTLIPPQTPAMLGLTFEIVYMAAVLAIRYSDERRAKQRIQQQALEQAQRIRLAREESLKQEAESNERLEQMVQERTLELEITLRELNEVNQKLTEQTTIDSLTGVKNRASFDKRLTAEGRISRRQHTPLALLMLDIDHFKRINDRYGHLAGDHTLKVIAANLLQHLKRPTDMVARYGGEEFAVILPATDEEGALAVAEAIRENISQLQLSWNQDSIALSVSIGVSTAIIDSDSHPLLLLEQADKALYRAKNLGRNRVCRYEEQTLQAVSSAP